MQKTKLGISVGLMGAAIYFMGAYGGYIITCLLVGYVLFCESNVWLKKAAVKALTLMICFSVLLTLINLLPNVIGVIGDIVGIFGGYFYVNWISSLAAAVIGVLNIMQKLLFIGLGIKALGQSDIPVKTVDKLIDRYMD